MSKGYGIDKYKIFTAKKQPIINTPVWVLPKIWRKGRAMDTKLGTNVSNRMLMNAAKFQGYSFYRFLVIKGKPTGGKITPSPPTRLRLSPDSNVEDIRHSISWIQMWRCLTAVNHPSQTFARLNLFHSKDHMNGWILNFCVACWRQRDDVNP